MRSLGNRIFSHMCPGTGSYCTRLLYHSEVRWLSRGYVLELIVALLSDVESFVCEESSLEVLVHQVNIKTNLHFIYICRNQKAECSVQGFDQTVIGLTWKVKFDVCMTVHR